MSNLSDEPHPELARVARETGTPYLRGTREGLAAIARYARGPSRASTGKLRPPAPAKRESAAKLLRQSSAPAEHEARAILAGYGIAGPKEHFVTSADDAAKAAAADRLPGGAEGRGAGHAAQDGGRACEAAARSDAQAVRGRCRCSMKAPGYLVQQMVSPVAELLVGARVDPDFGPLIVVGAGGVNVELYKDVAVRLAPIAEEEALAAIAATRVEPLARRLARRARRPTDSRGARASSALSRFIADFADEVRKWRSTRSRCSRRATAASRSTP